VVGYQKKEAVPMSFTKFYTPAMLALLVLAVILLIQAVRRRSGWRLCASLGTFALAGLSISLVMDFITRM